MKPLPYNHNGAVRVNCNLTSSKLKKDLICQAILTESAQPGKDRTLTNSGIVFTRRGNPFLPHMWDYKSLENKMVVLGLRQASATVFPSKAMIGEFRDWLKDRWLLQGGAEETMPTISEWIKQKKADGWSSTKIFQYSKNINEQLSGVWENWRNEFNLHVKNGEVYYTSEPHTDDRYMYGEKDRPRAIMCPVGALIGLVTYLMVFLFIKIKKTYKEFVHAENSQTFWDRTYAEIKILRRARSFSIDMSKHDAH